jgi:Flp pilus assembly protein protease CpaA
MSTYGLLMAVPAFTLLVWAAVTDLHSRRIPNWLTFSLVLGGFAQAIAFGALSTPLASVLGLCVGFIIPFVLFALGALGGGDVKLLAGVGAWFGPQAALNVFVIAALVGAVMVIAQALAQKRGKVLIRNTAVLAVTFSNGGRATDNTKATGQSCRSVDRPLPYAVPVLIAMAFLLASTWAPWRS